MIRFTRAWEHNDVVERAPLNAESGRRCMHAKISALKFTCKAYLEVYVRKKRVAHLRPTEF